ncbi:MAG: cell filamentation protein Fic [Azospirillum sp.]|nr:cell filamentation protein Fic [Azospirillum sp.]
MNNREAVEAKKRALDEARPLPTEAVEALADWFERELTFAASGLDGAGLSRDQVSAMLAGVPKPLAELPEAERQVVNLRSALQLVGGLSYPDGGPLSERSVKNLHRALRRGFGADAGHYRAGPVSIDHQNGMVGEERVAILPHFARVPTLMAGLGNWLASAEPSPEMALEAHYRLVRIMPFAWANHGVARLLMNVLLGRAGYPPIIVPPELREDYLDCLEVALVHGDKGQWRRFMIDLLDQSLDVCLVAAARALAATPPLARTR